MRGAVVNQTSSSGNTALHFAAVNNNYGVLEILLRSGADPSIPNEVGLIPIELSADNKTKMILSRPPQSKLIVRYPTNSTS